MDSELYITTKNERVLIPVPVLKDTFHFGVGRNYSNFESSLSFTSVAVFALKTHKIQEYLKHSVCFWASRMKMS